jgi:hypothetical protein
MNRGEDGSSPGSLRWDEPSPPLLRFTVSMRDFEIMETSQKPMTNPKTVGKPGR